MGFDEEGGRGGAAELSGMFERLLRVEDKVLKVGASFSICVAPSPSIGDRAFGSACCPPKVVSATPGMLASSSFLMKAP